MATPKRYHPWLVTLHWLVGILVVFNLYVGKFVFTNQDYPDIAGALHMAAGIAVLALVIVRFVVRQRSARPAEARSGSKFADVLAKVVHYGLYVMLIVITVVGLTFALQSGRLERTFLGGEAGQGTPQGGFPTPQSVAPGTAPGAAGAPAPGFQGRRPPSGIFILRGLHGLSANILLLLIALHVAAALYHQFIRKDNLIARMWYGAR